MLLIVIWKKKLKGGKNVFRASMLGGFRKYY